MGNRKHGSKQNRVERQRTERRIRRAQQTTDALLNDVTSRVAPQIEAEIESTLVEKNYLQQDSVQAVPTGGTVGQVLKKTSTGVQEWVWPRGEKDLENNWPTTISTTDGLISMHFGTNTDLRAVGALMLVTNDDTGETNFFDFMFVKTSSNTWKISKLEWEEAHDKVVYESSAWNAVVSYDGELHINVGVAQPVNASIQYSMVTAM